MKWSRCRPNDDVLLVGNALAGDETAQHRLIVERCLPVIAGVFRKRRRLGYYIELEDDTQDVLERLFIGRHGGPAGLSVWDPQQQSLGSWIAFVADKRLSTNIQRRLKEALGKQEDRNA